VLECSFYLAGARAVDLGHAILL